MTRQLFYLVSLLAVLAMIFAGGAMAQEPTFSHERLGVTFTPPAGWQISDNPGVVDVVNPADATESAEGPLMAGMSLRLFANPNRLPLATVAQRLAERMTADFDLNQPLSITPGPALNNPQLEQLIIVEQPPATFAEAWYLTGKDEYVYLISLNVGFLDDPAAARQQYQPLVVDLLNSMQLTTPTWAGYQLQGESAVALALRDFAAQFDYPLGIPDGVGWQVWQPFDNYHSGWLYRSYHAAEDWASDTGSSAGKTVYAVANGVVVYATPAGYPGDVVIVEHLLPQGEVWYSMYGHLGNYEVIVGQTIRRGDQIGTIYNWWGNSHLHFEIRDFLTQDDINGPASASGRHHNYPPGPGYWPLGRFRGTDERPADRGWVDPSTFIQAHRPVTATEAVLSGQILLQGLTDHRNSQIFLSEEPCTAEQPIGRDDNSPTGYAALTDASGRFTITQTNKAYQCLKVIQPHFLTFEYSGVLTGYLGSVTLPTGDLNSDNRIDVTDIDLIKITIEYGDLAGDLNADGRVDILDLSLVSLNYQRQGPLREW